MLLQHLFNCFFVCKALSLLPSYFFFFTLYLFTLERGLRSLSLILQAFFFNFDHLSFFLLERLSQPFCCASLVFFPPFFLDLSFVFASVFSFFLF